MKELNLTRTFDAPVSVVFKAWTDARQLAKWFGPKGFTTEVKEHDARPGGNSRIIMRGPDGKAYPGDAVFREVVPNQKLVMLSTAVDAKGKSVLETLQTITFSEKDKKTTVKVNVKVVKVAKEGEPYVAGMEEGWNQTLDKLGEVVRSSGR